MTRKCLLAVLVAMTLGCRAREPISLGIVIGGDGIDGAKLAAAEVNRTGGIDGVPLELAIVPSQQATLALPSIRVADSLAAIPGIVAVIGHSNSAASLAASQIYNTRHVPQVAPTTTAPLYGAAGPYSFRLVPDDVRQAEFLAAQVATAKAKRVAVLFVNDDYGRALRDALRTDLARAGVTVAYEAPYLEDDPPGRLEGAARSVAAASPELVLWLGRGPQLGEFYAALRQLSPTIPVLASEGVDTAPVYAHPEQFVGVRMVRFVNAQAPDPAMVAFRKAFRTATGRETTTDAVLGYDATMLVVAALRSGAQSREAIQQWLASIGTTRPPYTGLAGPIAFDANGDAVRPYQLAEVRADGVHALP